MSKCNISPIAYFQIRAFVDTKLSSTISSKESYDGLLDQLGRVFHFDFSKKDDQNAFEEILNNLPTSNNNVNSFINYAKNEFAKKNKVEVNKQIVDPKSNPNGNFTFNPQNIPSERAIELPVDGPKTELTINRPSPNRVDIAKNFFSNDRRLFSMFEKRVKKDLFRTAIVSFERGKASTVRSNAQLTSNVMDYYNKMLSDLFKFVKSKNPQAKLENVMSEAETYFNSNYTKNNISNLANDGNFAAYSNFVMLQNNFDDMVELYGLGVVHAKHSLKDNFDSSVIGKEKYVMNNPNKFAFSYGNDNYNILDETSELLSTLISTTPKVKKIGDGWTVSDDYLEINSAMFSMVKLKRAITGLKQDIRFHPAMSYKTALNEIVNDGNNLYSTIFSNEDLDNFRSIYTYYYSDESDNRVKDLNITSLSQIFAKEFAADNSLENDMDLFVNVTRHFDNAVEKKYTGLQFDRELNDWVNISLEAVTSNKHYQTTVSDLSAKINYNFKSVNDDHGDKIDGKKINFGNTQYTLNLSVPYGAKSSPLGLYNKYKDGTLEGEDRDFMDAIKLADEILDARLFINDAVGFQLLTASGEDSKNALQGMIKLAKNVIAFSNIKAEAKNEKEIISKLNNQGFPEDIYFKNGKILPFAKNGEADNMVTAYVKKFATVQAQLSGDTVKATLTSLNGNPVPAIGILAPTHDDNTNLEEVRRFVQEGINQNVDGLSAIKRARVKHDNIMLFNNIFGQTDEKGDTLLNRNFLKGEHLRTVIDKDGKQKDAAKMSASEIITQALLYDFFAGINTTGTASLQPLTYADKVGQMLKDFDMRTKIRFNGTEYDMSKITPTQLKKLHFESMGGQYLALEKLVVGDYRKMFQNIPQEEMIADVKIHYLTNDVYFPKDAVIIDAATNKASLPSEYNSNTAKKQLKKYNDAIDLANKIYNDRTTLKYGDFNPILEMFNETKLAELAVQSGIELTHEVHYSTRKTPVVNSHLVNEMDKYRDENKYNNALDIEKLKMVRDFLKTGVVIDGFEYTRNSEGKKEVTLTNSMNTIQSVMKHRSEGYQVAEWINPNTGEFIFAKDLEGNPVNLDMLKVSSKKGKHIDPIRQNTEGFVVNPALEFFFWSHNAFTANYNMITAGGIHAHEVKGAPYDPRNDKKLESVKDDESLMDRLVTESITSSRTTASDKRNVFAMATSWHFENDLVNGMPTNFRNSTINDTSFDLFNTLAQDEGFKNFDGSAIMNPFGAVLAVNSLGSMKPDSLNFKLIHHRLDPRTASAELEKYAVFTATNELVRKSVNSKIKGDTIIRKMSGESLSNPVNGPFDLFNPEFNDGTIIDVDPENLPGVKMFKYLDNVNVRTPEGEFYKIIGFEQITTPEGYEYIPHVKVHGSNSTKTKPSIKIDSVYDIWQALGGAYSIDAAEGVDGNLKSTDGNYYTYGDKSIFDATKIINGYRRLKDPNKTEFRAANYDQPLKHSMIYQLNNTSGIKNGAKNINPKKAWYDDTPFMSYQSNIMHWGIQLNPDHGFDEEHVAMLTEMSQVMSAAAFNGLYNDVVTGLYNNLASVVKFSMGKYNKALSEEINGNKAVYDLMTRELIKVLSDKDQVGLAQTYLENVKTGLEKLKKSGEEINVQNLSHLMNTPFSDNNFFGAMVSMITGAVNRSAIKRKYSGLAAVIKPGYDIYQIAVSENGIISNSEDINDKNPVQLKPATSKDFSFGDRLVLTLENGTNLEIDFDNPEDFIDYQYNPEAFIKIKAKGQKVLSENKAYNYPRNLRGYQVTFTDSEGNTFDRFSLPSVQAKFGIKKLKGLKKKLKGAQSEYNKVQFDSKNNYSDYQKEKARVALGIAEKAIEVFETSHWANSLRTALPDFDINGNLDEYDNRLIKEIEQDHIDLEKGKLRDGRVVKAHVKSGECLMSNFNRFKYGIAKGTKISQITEKYFLDKLNNIEFTEKENSEFYVTSLDGTQEIHFSYKDTMDNISADSKKKIKFATNADEDEEGNVLKYAIDPNTGRRLFRVNDNIEAYDVNGTLYLSYKSFDDLNDVLADPKFKYQDVRINAQYGNDDIIKDYLKNANKIFKYGERSKLLAILNGNSKDRATIYKSYKEDDNKINAKNLYNSWIKQLEVIGARIPAQSWQSFMAMEIVGFVDDDINTVILPTMKNWLDGSDFC